MNKGPLFIDSLADEYTELSLAKEFSPDHYYIYRHLKLNKRNLIADLEDFCRIYRTRKFYKIVNELIQASVIRTERDDGRDPGFLYANDPKDWRVAAYFYSKQLKEKNVSA